MEIITPEIREDLLANGRRTAAGEEIDPFPVVKLFLPDGKATWLVTEMTPGAEDVLYGIADLGVGAPECGDIFLDDVLALRGPTGLGVERDTAFRPDKTLSSYATAATDAGFLRA